MSNVVGYIELNMNTSPDIVRPLLEIFMSGPLFNDIDIDQLFSLYEYEIMNRSFEEAPVVKRATATQDEIQATLGHYKRVTKEDEGKECTICMETYKIAEGIRKCPCNHCFHKKCIDKWFMESSFSCPVCRKEFKENSERLKEENNERINE